MAAPSFTSFPDFDANPPIASLSDKEHKKDKSKKSRESGHSSKRKRERSSLKSTPVVADESPRLFFSDTTPDSLNARYGGLHRGDIPEYKRVGGGRKILGLPQLQALHRSDRGVEIGPSSGYIKSSSLTDSGARALLAAKPRLVKPKKVKFLPEEDENFISLGSRPQTQDAYRSITRDGSQSDTGSERDSSGAESDDSTTIALTSHQVAIQALERSLATNPASIPDWLAMLSRSLETATSSKARAEITLSVISRAFSTDSSLRNSVILRLKYLRAGGNVWHESTLRHEWEDALKLQSGDIYLEWLDWRANAGSSVEDMISAAARVLGIVGDERSKLRVLWRIALYFKHAGFTERSTALLQAHGELLFHCPTALREVPWEKRLESLADFWDSEVPRVGEEGSKGWAYWFSSTGEQGRHELRSQPPSEPVTSQDPYMRWASAEALLDHTRNCPSRSLDDELDPFATVLFPDIQPFIFDFQLKESKDAFRLVWLALLGLHVPGLATSISSGVSSWDDRWCSMHWTTPAYLDALFPSSTKVLTGSEAHLGVIQGAERSRGFGPIRAWGYGVVLDATFTSSHRMWSKVDIDRLDIDFVRCLFTSLRTHGDGEWDLLALAFEGTVNVKSALKKSKSMLSDLPDSLPHWAAHAALERMRDRVSEARKVYTTVLASGKEVNPRPGEALLWWDWATLEWMEGRENEALQVILRSSREEGGDGISVLRAKRTLTECIQMSSRCSERIAWTNLLALLDLLTVKDPSSALAVYDRYLDSKDVGSSNHESLVVAASLLIYRYTLVLKQPAKPEIIRQRLEQSLTMYPSNTIILSLFLEVERGQGVWGRVRGLLGEKIGLNKDTSRRVQEVWMASWGLGRWEGERDRIRSGLIAAMNNDRTSHSPVLWRIFIELEIRSGRLQNAKSLLFQALGECTLYKELYLLAFGALRTVFTAQELNSLVSTMAERGIRMHEEPDLDDFVANCQQRAEDAEMAQMGPLDEVEERAESIRRLRPY